MIWIYTKKSKHNNWPVYTAIYMHFGEIYISRVKVGVRIRTFVKTKISRSNRSNKNDKLKSIDNKTMTTCWKWKVGFKSFFLSWFQADRANPDFFLGWN